jgi:elongation factor Ts
MAESNKPKPVMEKIIQGKLDKYFTDVCLLEQPYVKTPEKKIGDYLKEQIAKYGENIRIKRFVRFKLGED